MYLCLDCDCLFDEPKNYIETHGLHSPPYEKWSGCPKCGGGAYVETMSCDSCGSCITGEYVKLNDGTVICESCYEVKNIADEGW